MQLSCLYTTRDAIINFEFVGGRPFTGQGIGDGFDIAKSNELVEGARVDAGATWGICWTVTNDDGRPVIAIRRNPKNDTIVKLGWHCEQHAIDDLLNPVEWSDWAGFCHRVVVGHDAKPIDVFGDRTVVVDPIARVSGDAFVVHGWNADRQCAAAVMQHLRKFCDERNPVRPRR